MNGIEFDELERNVFGTMSVEDAIDVRGMADWKTAKVQAEAGASERCVEMLLDRARITRNLKEQE